MTVKEEARKAQTDQFERFGEEGEPVLQSVIGLYDKIDALNPDQRALLVFSALRGIAIHVRKMMETPAEGGVSGYGAIAAGLCGLAGYATELTREESGSTSTGDKKVEEVLDGFGEALRAQNRLMMPKHLAEVGDRIVEAARARAAAGEDLEEALLDELSKVDLPENPETVEAPAAANPSTPGGYGLYL